jgi:hypothetical protein
VSLRAVALDALAVGILLSLLSIVLFFLLASVTSLTTVARARRQLRQHARKIGEIPGLSDRADLVGIDEALERVMSEESGALARILPG